MFSSSVARADLPPCPTTTSQRWRRRSTRRRREGGSAGRRLPQHPHADSRPRLPRPSLPPSSSSSSAALAADHGLNDDDFNDPYDAIDFQSIAALTARAQAGAAGAGGGGDDDDEDDVGSGEMGVADEVVDADLRALMREIQQERGGRDDDDDGSGDGDENDEEDELSRLEKEHEEEEQKQPLPVAQPVSAALPPSVPPSYPTAAPSPERLLAEQETRRRLQAESVRPSLPAAPPPALSGDAALAALRTSLEGSRRRALEYHKAGKKEEALEVMKSVKTLQARIQIMETQQQQTAQPAAAAGSSPSPAASPSSAASASPSPSSESELQSALKLRLLEYQRAAVFHKQAGRIERAKQLMLDILRMKAVLEAGRALTAADIPPPLDIASQPPRLMRQSSGSKGGGLGAAAAAPLPSVPPRPAGRPPLPASSPSSSSASAAAQAARSPASGLTTRQSLQYENLIQALTSQANELRHEIAQLMAAAASAKPAAAAAAASSTSTERTYKLLALQYHRLLKRTQTDLDLLRPAMQRGIPPPSFHHVEERLTSIHENTEVADDQLVLLLLSSRELSDAVHSITLQWEGVGQPLSWTSAAMKGPSVEWKGRWAVGMGKRTKQAVRAVQRSRLVLLLHRHRMLLGNVEEGRGELRLKELAGRCDKRETVKLKDAEGKRVGEATVEVRLRRPLERMEVKENSRQLLVIDEFEQQSQVAAAAAAQHSASPHSHSPQPRQPAAASAHSPSPASPPPHSSSSPSAASALAAASASSTSSAPASSSSPSPSSACRPE